MRAAETTFSCSWRATWRVLLAERNVPSSVSTIRATSRCTGGVPSTSLVWPSNWGSASLTVTTEVRPSMQSSLTISSPAFNSPRVPSNDLTNALVNPRSKPLTCVPPFGVAMMLTKDRSTVS